MKIEIIEWIILGYEMSYKYGTTKYYFIIYNIKSTKNGLLWAHPPSIHHPYDLLLLSWSIHSHRHCLKSPSYWFRFPAGFSNWGRIIFWGLLSSSDWPVIKREPPWNIRGRYRSNSRRDNLNWVQIDPRLGFTRWIGGWKIRRKCKCVRGSEWKLDSWINFKDW